MANRGRLQGTARLYLQNPRHHFCRDPYGNSSRPSPHAGCWLGTVANEAICVVLPGVRAVLHPMNFAPRNDRLPLTC